MKILIIDNYDSFTYNLFQYIGEIIGNEPIVFFNNKITKNMVNELMPDKIVISPGPGTPYIERDRGNCSEIIKAFYKSIPILGVCLGHQILAYTFKGRIINSSEIMHGKCSKINIYNSEIFSGLSRKIIGMRYHSLMVERETLPSCFNVIADLDNGTIMGLNLKNYSVYGLQFHPESIGTAEGKKILRNFILI